MERLERRELLTATGVGDESIYDPPLVSNADLLATARPAERHPVFAPGTPSEYVESLDSAAGVADVGSEAPLAPLQLGPRWQRTATDGSGLQQGDATTLTWSIVPDGTPIVGEDNDPSDLVARLGEIYGVTSDDTNYTDEPWFPLFQRVFDRWSAVAGLTYVYEPNDDGVAISGSSEPGVLGVRGDARIGGHRIDGDSGILAYNYFPNNGDMVIDTDDDWYVDQGVPNDSLGLRNVLAHELGHGIGLAHVLPVASQFLMEPFINLNFDGPQYDDILGTHRHYGDVFEADFNDTPAGATSLGTLLNEQLVQIGTDASTVFVSPINSDFVSIDGVSDADVFQFQLLSGGLLDLTLTPVGPTYLEGPQFGAPPELFDAARQNDLSLELLDQDGTTLLTLADSGGLGETESIVDFALPTGGTYFARVQGALDRAQTYQLELFAETQVAPLITGDGSPTNSDPFAISINFFSGVTDFDQSDLDVVNGTVANFTVIDASSGQFAAQIDANADGPVTVSIPEGAALDETSSPTAASLPFTIVIDTTPPNVTAPADIQVEANTTGGATITQPEIVAFLGGATASDAIDTDPAITNDAPTLLPLGPTDVAFTAIDEAGNSAIAIATVTVVDTQAPRLSLPPDSTLEGDVTGGTSIDNIEIQAFLARARGDDIVDGSVTVTHDAPDVFPLGDTAVTFTATDDSGNSDVMVAVMTIEDTTPPVVQVPANIEVEADMVGGVAKSHPDVAAFLSAATASDIVDADVTITNDAPDILRIGDNVVVFTATDDDGNQSSGLATVTVTDFSPPSLVVPESIAVEAGSSAGMAAEEAPIAQFLSAATATDLIDFAVTIEHDAPEVFPLGETLVTFSAVDDFGNRSQASGVIEIVDTVPPTLQVPPTILVEANAAGGYRVGEETAAAWLAAVRAVDVVHDFLAIEHDAPALIPLGTHTVTWTATDPAGNGVTATTAVTVTDTTAPDLTGPAELEISTYHADGIGIDDARIREFLQNVIATDIADEAPVTAHDAPARLAPGTTRVNFTARDSAGNTAAVSSSIKVSVADPAAVSVVTPDGADEGPETARGPRPTSWQVQRHDLRELVVELGIPINAVAPGDVVLTNLGVDADREADTEITLADDQLSLSDDGHRLTISLDAGQLTDGVYRLDLLPAITGDVTVSIEGNAENQLFVLTGDWNGDAAFDAADLAVLGYWNGEADRPEYSRLAPSPALTAESLGELGRRFGRAIRFPGDPSTAAISVSTTDEFESLVRSLLDPFDVNGDGGVTAADALNVVNRLSDQPDGPLGVWSPIDVNADGIIAASDALAVINRLARQGGESEATVALGSQEAEIDSAARQPMTPSMAGSRAEQEKIRGFSEPEFAERSNTPVSPPESRVWSQAVDRALDEAFLAELV